MSEEENNTATTDRPVRKRKHKLPSGKVTPVEFRHMLVDEGLAPDTLNSAQLYILSRAAKSNGMPVKHYDAAGNEYDEFQTDKGGNTTTRPGIDPEAGLDWWKNRPKRGQGGAKKKKDAGDGETAEGEEDKAESEGEPDLDDEFDDDDDEEDTEEAE